MNNESAMVRRRRTHGYHDRHPAPQRTVADLVKIVIAPDSFKESVSAPDAAAAIARGVKAACPGAQTVCIPMADGGEGTVEAVLAAFNAS